MKYIEKHLHQVNLTAELYHYFRVYKSSYKMVLEYKVDHCIFDAVIIKDGNIIGIIEARRYNSPPERINYKGKKHTKYSNIAYDVPIYYLSRYDHIPNIVSHFP